MAAPTITRTAITDDDGTLTTGTVINNAWKTELYGQIDAVIAAEDAAAAGAAVVQTTTSTGTQNDFALTARASVLRCNNASLLTITGLAAGFDGQRLTIVSIGAGQVDLSHQAAGSTAANRLINIATSSVTSLFAGSGVAVLVYDGTTVRWRLVTHDQGAWITPTFAAGNFTGNGSMTWTLASGDVILFRYYLRGRTLTVAFQLDTTTVGGTLNTTLQVSNAAWGSYTAVTGFFNALGVASDAGTAFLADANTTSGTILGFQKAAGTNWSAATDTTYIRGQITFEVT